MDIQFDKKGFIINGKRDFQISGEFPYFRVPKSGWRERLQLFIDCGGNCVTSYVPWILHEPEEGKFLFDDCDYRDLTDFLKLTKEMGLAVMLRPGPYQYSEMIYDGMPTWLHTKYPQIMAKNIDGKSFYHYSVSYLHPVFLEKVEKYFAAFADVVRPFMSCNGGHVYMLQVDNEIVGAHEWHGSIDYNPESMGFGDDNGRFALWLKKKYGTIEALNAAYGSNYTRFGEVIPERNKGNSVYEGRKIKDYRDFYFDGAGEYAVILRDMLYKYGLNVPISHNAGGTDMIPMLKELSDKMGDNFILGRDCYYALNITWPGSPNFKYLQNALLSADYLKDMGYPYTVPEMQCGSYSDFPPALEEDIYLADMINLAAGLKGINHYVFAGGKNPENIGAVQEVYDFNAPISPDGEVRKTYNALVRFHNFLREHKWLAGADRLSTVQIGYEWQSHRSSKYAAVAGAPEVGVTLFRTEICILSSILASKYTPVYAELTGELDIGKPLILTSPTTMSENAQRKLVEFMERGGKVVFMGAIPKKNEDFAPCTILADALGGVEYDEYNEDNLPYIDAYGKKVYKVSEGATYAAIPALATVLATHAGKPIGFECKVGKGTFITLNAAWLTTGYAHVELMEKLLEDAGAKSIVASSNGSVFTTYFSDGERNGVFVMNLYSGEQSTVITATLPSGKSKRFSLTLPAASVEFLELNEEE